MNVVGKPSLHMADEAGGYSRSDSGLAGNQSRQQCTMTCIIQAYMMRLFVGKKPLRHMNAIRRERSQSNGLDIPRSGNASKGSNTRGDDRKNMGSQKKVGIIVSIEASGFHHRRSCLPNLHKQAVYEPYLNPVLYLAYQVLVSPAYSSIHSSFPNTSSFFTDNESIEPPPAYLLSIVEHTLSLCRPFLYHFQVLRRTCAQPEGYDSTPTLFDITPSY